MSPQNNNNNSSSKSTMPNENVSTAGRVPAPLTPRPAQDTLSGSSSLLWQAPVPEMSLFALLHQGRSDARLTALDGLAPQELAPREESLADILNSALDFTDSLHDEINGSMAGPPAQ
mmetsp:Transcript_7885/g.21978  ORF Transcript_7885/g.21978 Transcript_7885/m.21978 type:complete len:117 (+) Transcript_7885:296-646(+)